MQPKPLTCHIQNTAYFHFMRRWYTLQTVNDRHFWAQFNGKMSYIIASSNREVVEVAMATFKLTNRNVQQTLPT